MPNWKKLIVSGSDANLNSLDVTANNTIGGLLKVADGTAAAPSITFTNDTNTGIFKSAANALTITTDGTTRFTVNANGITSAANIYSGTTGQFRNYAGIWKATTGTTGNGFQFISADATALTLSSTGNATFAGTIVTGDNSNDNYIQATFSDSTYTRIHGYGLYMSRSNSYIRPTTDTGKTLYIGSADKRWDNVNVHATSAAFSGDVTVDGTTVFKHGGTTFKTTFGHGNEINTETAAGADATMYLNYRSGTVNIANSALKVDNAGNSTIKGHLIPDADTTYDLGTTASKDFRTLFIRNIDVYNQRIYIDSSGTLARFYDHPTVGDGIQFLHLGTEILRLGNGSSTTSTFAGDVTINKATPILTFNSSNVNVDQGIVFSNAGTFDASIKHGPSTADMVFDIGRNSTWGGAANFKLDTYQTYYMTRNSHAFKILGVNALSINSSSNATFAGDITITDTSGTRGVSRNNTGYNLQLMGGTDNTDGAFISLSGETRGGAANSYNGRIEIYSGGGGLANQAAALGDIIFGTKWNGGSSNILVLDSSTNNATFAGDVISGAIVQAKGFRTETGSTDYSLLTRNSTNTAVYIQQAGTGNIVDFRYGSQAAGQGTSAMFINASGNATFAGNITAPGLVYNATNKYLSISHWSSPPTPAAILHLSDNSNDLDVPQIRIEGRENPGDTVLDIAVKDADVRFNLVEGSTDAASGYGRMHFKTNASANSSHPTRGGFLFQSGPGSSLINVLDITNEGNASFAGDVTVAGTLTAQQFNTELVSASIVFESGSTIFGNSTDDTHKFTGTLDLATYGSGNNTGTLAYTLGVDSSGNLIEFSGGAGGGAVSAVSAGADNRVAVFSGADSLEGDSGFTFDGTKLTVEDTIAIQRNGVSAGTSTIQQTGTGLIINAPSGYHPLVVQHNGTEFFRLRNDGKLGVGLASPSTKFQVKSGGADDGFYLVRSDNTNLLGGIIQTGSGDGALVLRNTSNSQVVLLRGNGNNYINGGNLGIGTASPDQKLHVEFANTDTSFSGGSAGAWGSEGIRIENTISTAGTMAMLHFRNNDADIHIAGIRQATDDSDLGFFFEGTERVRFTKSGNVGIGTTSPANKLEVHSGETNVVAAFKSSDNQAWISVHDDDSGTYGALFGTDTDAGHDIVLADKSANKRLVIDSSGNVGIGTDSPGGKLDVHGDLHVGSGGNKARLKSDGTHTYLDAIPNNSDLVFRNAGSVEKMRIDSAGNVGIGTTSPNYKLAVYGSSANSEIVASFGSANDQNEYTAIGLSGFIASNGATKAGLALKRTSTYGTGELHFLNNNTTDNSDMTLSDSKMTILGNGNVGINTNNPITKFQISAANASSPTANIFLDIDGANTPGMGGQIIFGTSTSGTLTDYIARIQGVRSALDNGSSDLHFQTTHVATASGPTTKMTILSGGNVGIGTTSPGRKLEVDFTGSVYGAKFTRSDATGSSLIEFANSAGVKSIIGYDAGVDGYKIGTASATNLVVKQSGNVGIGTTSPENRLHLLTTTTDETQQLLIQNGSSGDAAIKFNISGDTYSLGIDNSDSDKFKLSLGNLGINDRLVIDSTGNVGIGTASPLGKLMVREDSAGSPTKLIVSNGGTVQAGTTARLSFYEGTSEKGYIERRRDGSGRIAFYTPADDNPFVWENPSGEIMRITNSKVGIGTTSPGYKLDVAGDINSSTGLIRRGGNAIIKSSGAETMIGPGGAGIISFHSSATMTTGDETVRIDANGNLLLNNTSANARLDIREDSNYALRLEDASGHYFRVNTGGDTEIRGNVTVQGTITAQEFHTELVSASIIYESGSTKFGDTQDDVHDFTGSLNVSGSVHLADISTLKLGNATGGDLQLYHNGSHSLINNQTGNLYIRNQTNDGKVYFQADDGAGNDTTYFYLDGGQSDGTNFATRFPDQSIILLGSGTSWNDGTQIYHNGTNFYLNEYAGDINITVQTNDGDIKFSSDNGSGGVTQYVRIDGSSHQTLFFKNTEHQDGIKGQFGNSGDLSIKHDGTNSYIENETGHLNIVNYADGKDTIFWGDDGSGGIDQYFKIDPASDATHFIKRIYLQDNVKAQFGNSSDLKIYHDGSNSYIEDVGTGVLNISSNQLNLNASNGENGIQINENADVKIRHNNVVKFATTSTGVTVTGDIDADDITIDDWGSVSASLSSIQNAGGVNGSGAANRVALWSDGDTLTSDAGLTYSSDTLFLEDADYTAMRINASVDHHSSIEFMSASVTTGRIGWHNQGYFASSAMGANPSPAMFINAPNGFDFAHNNTGSLSIKSGSADVIIDEKVKVGVGVASPSYPLHVYAGGSERFAVSGDVMVRGATDLMVTGTSRRLSFTSGTGTVRTTTANNLILQTNSTTALTLDSSQNATFAGNVDIYTGDGSATLNIGRNASEKLQIDQTDQETVLTANNDSDSNGTHNFRLNRVFAGTGANNFKIQKGGTDQFSIDTNANATFAGNVRLPSSGKLFLWTGHDSNFLQYNLWQASASGGMTIKNIASGGDIIFQTVSTTALTIDSSQNSTFAGDISTSGNIYLNNNKTIFGKNTSGSNYGLLTITSGNVVKLGAYAYTSAATEIGLGDNGKFLIGTAEALSIDSSKKATFAGNVVTLGGLTVGDSNADTAQIGLKHLLGYCENTDVDTGTEDIKSLPLATYQAVFFDYVVKNGTNLRAGTVTAVHDGTNVEFTDTSTKDLGNTSGVTLSVDINGTNMRLRATTTSDNWIVKANIRGIKV